MNHNKPNSIKTTVYVIAILGIFLIGAGLVRIMNNKYRPAPLGAERVELRKKNLAELKAANEEALNNFAWQDETRKIVRLPISEAMKIVEREWKNPASGRSNLIALVDKATAAAPKTAAPANPYE